MRLQLHVKAKGDVNATMYRDEIATCLEMATQVPCVTLNPKPNPVGIHPVRASMEGELLSLLFHTMGATIYSHFVCV